MTKKNFKTLILFFLLLISIPLYATTAQEGSPVDPVGIGVTQLNWRWPNSQTILFAEPESYPTYIPVIFHPTEPKAIGPFGGSVTALAISPTPPYVVYAGTYGGGLFISADRGKSWIYSSKGLTNPYVLSLVIDPLNPEILYAGTYGNGVFKSINAGLSWQPTGPGLNEIPIVYSLVIDPKEPNNLYAATRNSGELGGGGVYASTNGGASWQARNIGLGERYVYDLAIDPSNPYVLFAATHERGVYKTYNAGFDWTNVNIGILDRSARTLLIDPSSPNIIYLGTWHGESIYKSDNGGGSWFSSSYGIFPAKVYSSAIDPVNPQTLYAATYFRGVFKSVTGGTNWTQVGLPLDFVYSLDIDPANHNTILAGTMNNGIYRSENGGSDWSSSQHGLSATSITSIVMASASSPAVYVGTNGSGLFSTSDNGESWSALSSVVDDKYIYSILQIPTSPNILYTGTRSGGVYKSEDGGTTWRAMNIGLPVVSTAQAGYLTQGSVRLEPLLPEQGLWNEFDEAENEVLPANISDEIAVSILSSAADPNDPSNLYLGTSSGVYKSQNAGGYWSGSGLGGRVISSLVIDPFQSNNILAATSAAAGSLFKSTTAGSSWVPANTGLIGLGINSIWSDPNRANVFFAATDSGIYKSENGGTVWNPSGLAGQWVYSISGSPTNPFALYAGTNSGLYKSNNYGRDWASAHPSLTSKAVRTLLAHPTAEQTLYLGTTNNGVFLWTQFEQ
jgi:photosystem II stability/assembly factor-like uncharacterized protein